MFYVLTFGISWLLWLPLLAWLRSERRLGARAGEAPLQGLPWWVGVAWFAGASAPSVVALALTAVSDGWAAAGDLVARLVDVDVGLGWNAVALAGPMAVGLAATAIVAGRGGVPLRISPRRFPLVIVALGAALPFGPLGEELGWRGYALPRLLADHGALASAVVLGVVWSAWHLPVFWAPLGTSISGSPVTVAAASWYVVEVTSISVVMTWLFVNTGGSLWIAVWFHAAWNAAMHRFWFAPWPDDAARRVERAAVVLFAAAALVLALWPGLGWRSA